MKMERVILPLNVFYWVILTVSRKLDKMERVVLPQNVLYLVMLSVSGKLDKNGKSCFASKCKLFCLKMCFTG